LKLKSSNISKISPIPNKNKNLQKTSKKLQKDIANRTMKFELYWKNKQETIFLCQEKEI
jgi:hypothetical protein